MGRIDPNRESEDFQVQEKGRKSSHEKEHFPEMKMRTPILSTQDSEQDPHLGVALSLSCMLS